MAEDHLIALVAIVCAVIAAVIVSSACVVGVFALCVEAAPEALAASGEASPSASSGGGLFTIREIGERLSEALPDLPEGAASTEGKAEAESAADEAASDVASQVADLVSSGGIVMDGVPLDSAQAEVVLSRSGPYAESVSFIDQRDILPAGCEIVALSVALRAEGFDASPVEIAENHLDMSGSSERSYGGSPWNSGGGFPASVVDAGNSWLAAQAPAADGARVVDLTGTTFEGVLDLVSLGYPVLTWTTEDMAEPAFSGGVQGGLEWYYPEHCVVVYGLEGLDVLVSDSLVGLTRRDRAEFERIYGACGNMAAFVLR